MTKTRCLLKYQSRMSVNGKLVRINLVGYHGPKSAVGESVVDVVDVKVLTVMDQLLHQQLVAIHPCVVLGAIDIEHLMNESVPSRNVADVTFVLILRKKLPTVPMIVIETNNLNLVHYAMEYLLLSSIIMKCCMI